MEIFSFLFQFLLYNDPDCLNIELGRNVSAVFVDLVYFTTISLTTIGFGDIAPTAHYTKLVTSLMGLMGTFYTVVLTGILISNFAPHFIKTNKKQDV
ncbi:potassium channel family protein [Niabella insulamsoli]|uniref:potassium channel family protein n=1 Tax=Niabella insulamsoli TaxID=3144874 RepID=UPI0031FE1C09